MPQAVGDRIELGAVAGRERGAFAQLRVRAEDPEHRAGGAAAERRLLALLDRRGFVRQADRDYPCQRARPPGAADLQAGVIAAGSAGPPSSSSARARRLTLAALITT